MKICDVCEKKLKHFEPLTPQRIKGNEIIEVCAECGDRISNIMRQKAQEIEDATKEATVKELRAFIESKKRQKSQIETMHDADLTR